MNENSVIITENHARKNALDLLSRLGGMRGFIMNHEVSSEVIEEIFSDFFLEESEIEESKNNENTSEGVELENRKKTVQYPFIDFEFSDTIKLPVSNRKTPMELLGDTSKNIVREEREKLLWQLDEADAQLLGWLIISSSEEEESEEINLSPEHLLLQKEQDNWEFLLRPAESPVNGHYQTKLSVFFSEKEIGRKLRRQMINHLLQDNIQYFGDDDPILYWSKIISHLRMRLLEQNIRLVAYWAKVHRGQLNFDDAMRQGLIGLSKAIDAFNPGRGNQLSTYASWWIRQVIARTSQNMRSSLRIPVHLFNEIRLVYFTFRNAWLPGKSFSKTIKETEENSKLSSERIKYLILLNEKTWPATRKINSDQSIEEILFDPNRPSMDLLHEKGLLSEVRNELHEVLNMTKKRGPYILSRRFAIGYQTKQTLDQLGKKYSITRERVRQIEELSLEKIRRLHVKKKLQPLFHDFITTYGDTHGEKI